MPEENPIPSPPKPKKRNERTEAKFLEHAAQVIAEAVREGAEYQPPNPAIAALTHLQTRHGEVAAKRTAYQNINANIETARNGRENLYKPLRSDVRSVIDYVKSSGKPQNAIDALNSIARDISGKRAGERGANSVSVSQLSYASLADNYSRFIEQYASLGIPTTEEMYEVSTHRDKLAALQAANANIITLEAEADSIEADLDDAAYLAEDSLFNGCVSAKNYIKSKYKGAGAFKNISKTSFILPTRLRR
jgi:hypothetical protein